MSEEDLKAKAVQYLKRQYSEDTVSMDVVKNDVLDGSGVFQVDCTVSVNGAESDWTKWFTFRNGDVVSMDWRMH